MSYAHIYLASIYFCCSIFCFFLFFFSHFSFFFFFSSRRRHTRFDCDWSSDVCSSDLQWMGHLFKWLGLTVGCIDDTEPGSPERRAAYQCDITYGTNNEFGFDYLRDNMVFALEQRGQRGHHYAIIDEVDSIRLDEARPPV